MINHSMRRASNIHKHNLTINRELRENLNGNKAKVLWFTGISGSGKSTIADELEKELFSNGTDIRTDFKQERHSVDAKILIEKNLKETLEALVKHLFGQEVEYRNEIYFQILRFCKILWFRTFST